MIRTTRLPLSMSLAAAIGLAPLAFGQQPAPIQPGQQPGVIQPGQQPGVIQPGQVQPGQIQPGQQPAPIQPGQQPGQIQAGQQAQGGQTVEAQWLDALPGDLPVIVRIGGLEQATNNLVTMLRAMSPETAQQIGSQIQATVSEFARSLGAGQGQTAALLLIDVVPPNRLGEQVALEGVQLRVRPRAIAVFATNDYRQALASITNQPNVQAEQRQGGYEAVTTADGERIFAIQRQGYAAVTQHEDLIQKVASPGQQNLGQTIADDLRSHFLDGDLGIYVDMARINETYAQQGEQARNFLRQQVDRLGEQNPEAAEQIRSAYQQVFEAAENARALAANANFAEQGLSVSGKLAMNEGFEPIRRMAEQGDDPADELAKLPQGSAYYAFDMLDPETLDWDVIPSGDQIREDFPEFAAILDSPEFEQAKEQFRAAGTMRTAASLGLGETRQGVCVIQAENSESVVEAVRSFVDAVKGRDFSLIKDLSIEQGAQEHQGYSFDKVTASYDFDAFTKEVEERTEEVKQEVQQRIDDENVNQNIDRALADRPIDRGQAVELLRRIAGDSTTLWIGSNGEQVLSILAETWEDAQSQIDSYLANDRGIGQTDSFRKVREQLPDRVRSLYLLDLQTGTRQVLAEARQATGDQEIRAPQQMPEQPALIGLALVAEQDGIRFQGFVPSEVGPVIERGIVPLIEQQLNQQGQGQQQPGGQPQPGQVQPGQPQPGQVQPGQVQPQPR